MPAFTIIIFIFMVLILLAVVIYSPFRMLSWILFTWIEKNKWRYFAVLGFSIIFVLIAIVGFIFGHFRGEKFGRILLHISTNIIVFSFTGLFPCLFLEIVFGIIHKSRDYCMYVGGGLAFLILLYMVIGLILGGKVHIKTIKVRSSSAKIPLRIVHISDTHVGSHGESFFTNIIEKTNSLTPDIVCITGDLVDSTSLIRNDSLSEDIIKRSCHFNIHQEMHSLRDLRTKYGVYFVFGNHDFMCGEEQVMKVLKEYPNVCVLRNESKTVAIPASDKTPAQQIHLIGIDDCSEGQFIPILREVLGITSYPQGHISEASPLLVPETNSFTILLHHRPLTHLWKDVMKMCGADMMLVGHTHKGQTFPIWPLVLLVFRPYGGLHMLENNKETSYTPFLYVSPGTGTWGTNLRTASRNEITLFEIEPDDST